LGKDTVFTAEQVAQAQTELAKAGLTSAQILATTGETLNLATAGQLELAAAATLTADTLNQFQLPADNAGRVVDALAFAANKSSTSVDLMGQSMKYVAPISSALGVSIEETAALIGTLANQGFKGEQATASFATSLTRLASPSKEAAKLMKETGTQIFDNTGKFVGYEKAVAEFARVTKDMNDEQRLAYLSTVAGADATKQWTALIGAGSQKLGDFARDINAVTDGNGKFTESLAATNLDNYAGAVEQFDGAVNSLSITIGKNLLPVLTELAKWGTSVIDIFSGDRSFKTAFADATAGIIKFVTYGNDSGLADMIFKWGHAEEFAAKAVAQTNKELAVRQQKAAEEQQSAEERQKQTLARMRLQLKELIAANEKEVEVVKTTQAELSGAQKKANEARILQLQQEEYELMQLNALMEDSLRLEIERAALFDEMKGATFTITNIGSVGGTYASHSN
jgi:TP901 family phage tail tape measure protein